MLEWSAVAVIRARPNGSRKLWLSFSEANLQEAVDRLAATAAGQSSRGRTYQLTGTLVIPRRSASGGML